MACKITQMVGFFSDVFVSNDIKSLNIPSDSILRFVITIFNFLQEKNYDMIYYHCNHLVLPAVVTSFSLAIGDVFVSTEKARL